MNKLLDTPEGCLQLESVGGGRGGWQQPSPLWADWTELARDYYPGINQVVGHSPQRTCVTETTETGEVLWCCDTFSTSSKFFRLGDSSMLLLDTDEDNVSIVYPEDSVSLENAYAEYFMSALRGSSF